MPIDFQETRIRFASDTGGPRTASHRFEFPSNVTKAATFINGFNIGFTRVDPPSAGAFGAGAFNLVRSVNKRSIHESMRLTKKMLRSWRRSPCVTRRVTSTIRMKGLSM